MPDIVPKILIVHAPPQQVTLQAVLAPLAYTCLVAEDVPTARRILAEQTPHLIILDPKLPAALDFCAEVIHLAHAPAPRVLIYADDHAEDTVRAALDAGADDYCHTSVPAPLLLNDVRRLVEQHSNTAHLAYLQRLNAALYADATMLNTGAVFQTMLDVVGNALHAKSAFIVRHDPESDLADIMVSYAGFGAVLPPKGDWEMHTFSLDDFPVSGEWILQDAPYLAINLQDYTFEGVEARFFAQLEPDEKMLHVTIPLDEAPHRYYMQIWRHGYFGPFTALEIQLVMSVAHQVTANLRSARLYDALKRSQDELQNYTAALEARNLELDAYAHTIAHRLKSPLNLIANLALLLADDERDVLSEAGQDTLRTIEDYAHNMAAMVDQMLRLAAARQSAAPLEALDVHPLVEDVIHLQMSFMRAQGVLVYMPERLPRARGHAAWVQEIFSNLTHNAAKYMPAEQTEPRITITGAVEGAQVRYSVTDNGAGIPPDQQARVFDMFFSGGAADSTNSGLGLAIVQRLVHNMGGTVGLQSTPGQGSTFWFTLPASLDTPND